MRHALNESGARYLLIGGFAVIAHGAGRFTKDIDLRSASASRGCSAVVVGRNRAIMERMTPRPGVRASLTCMAVGLFATAAGAHQARPTLDDASQAWMRGVLETWVTVARDNLRISPDPLPWLIFYDEQQACHVNAEATRLPDGRVTVAAVPFAGRDYLVHALTHAPDVWLPAGEPLTIRADSPPSLFSMPYGDGRQAFVVMPLPSLLRRFPGAETTPDLEALFVGVAVHEIAHTRQLGDVARQIATLRESHAIPPGITENLIQQTFAGEREYAAIYAQERDTLFRAAGDLEANPESSRRLVREALAIAEKRRTTFFTGDRAVFRDLDDIFLVLEGVGVWAQLQAARVHAPKDTTWQQTAMALLSRNTDWVQEEGLVLFVLIDHLVPGWQQRFLVPDFPSPFAVLREALAAPEAATPP